MSNFNKNEVKRIIKEWIIRINEQEKLPKDIIALNFGLYEPYGIELIGSKSYDKDDDDWACDEDFVPEERVCSELNISRDIEWSIILNYIVEILLEIINEIKDIELLNVNHITTGFCDGDLVIVR